MKQNINFNAFCDAFPESRDETFSYDGKKALFDYLEEYEESTKTEIEMDIVALCCEFTEYASVEDYLSNYYPSEVDNEKDEGEEDEDFKDRIQEETLKYLEDNTTVILLNSELNDGFIIQDF